MCADEEQVLFEVPVFARSERFLERLGVPRLLALGSLCYAARVLVYTVVPPSHAWAILFVEPLHARLLKHAALAVAPARDSQVRCSHGIIWSNFRARRICARKLLVRNSTVYISLMDSARFVCVHV